MLQVHNWSDGKKTLKQLPSLKIQCSRSGDLGDLFSGFFITDSKNFKDVGLAFSWGFERVDIFFEGRARSRSKGVPGWFWLCVGHSDLLGTRRCGQAWRRGWGATVLSIVSSLPAPKTLSFLCALCSFDWGEFRQGDGIYIHGIGIVVGVRGKMGLGGDSSFSQGEDTHLLGMEDLWLINPSLDRKSVV